jgi:uncharacterized protein DUF4124
MPAARRARGDFLQRSDDGQMRSRILIAALLGTACALPAAADVLYKSVDANGTVMFSDTPPPDGARILEQRALPSTSPAPSTAPMGTGLEQAYGLLDADAALARANTRVDLAEHALALARNDSAARTGASRLASVRPSRADEGRIEFYKRDLKIARNELIELLRSRQLASR